MLFGTFITPVILGGNDAKWPEDTDSQFNLVLSAFVTAIGFWLFYKFGSQKLREMSLASDAAMPNRQDPFTPTVPGQQSAMPEWSAQMPAHVPRRATPLHRWPCTRIAAA